MIILKIFKKVNSYLANFSFLAFSATAWETACATFLLKMLGII
jgi:hypothetical protein